jgi:hypothetical protein
VTVRVISSKFDAAFDDLKEVALVVRSENVNTQDVTEEFVDLEARLQNKYRQEERLLDLFDKADKVEDLIKVESELARVRSDIERWEGRKRYLSSQTDYAQIVVMVEEDEKIVVVNDQWRPLAVARTAFNNLVTDIQDTASVAIRFLVWFIPLFILYAFGLFILWMLGKKIVALFTSKRQK